MQVTRPPQREAKLEAVVPEVSETGLKLQTEKPSFLLKVAFEVFGVFSCCFFGGKGWLFFFVLQVIFKVIFMGRSRYFKMFFLCNQVTFWSEGATLDGSEIPRRQPRNMYGTRGTYWEKTTISTGKFTGFLNHQPLLKPTLLNSPA